MGSQGPTCSHPDQNAVGEGQEGVPGEGGEVEGGGRAGGGCERNQQLQCGAGAADRAGTASASPLPCQQDDLMPSFRLLCPLR